MTQAVLAVVAHPDDDLLFLNPDLDAAIDAGVATTVVYVTGGHAALTGIAGNERVRSRQRGVQDAYRVAGGVLDRPGQGEWVGRAVAVAGREVEEYRLRDRPAVHLVFLSLPDAGLASVLGGATVTTVPPAGGLVTASQTYDAATAVAVLQGLLERYRPAALAITEEYADARYDDPISHPDHRAAAALALKAADRHRAGTGSWMPQVVQYRDYGNGLFPADLDVVAGDHKRTLFTVYQAWDPDANDSRGWTRRTYYRHSRGTQWSAVDESGSVHLFAVRDGRVLSWRGGPTTWTGPTGLGGDVTAVTAVRGEDGRVQLAARTTDHRVVTRPAVGGGWTDLGTPGPGDAPRHVGTPALTSNADGRLQVFVVNADGGLSTRWQSAGGGWAPWLDLFGSDLQDPCSAVLGPSGRIEVVAATRSGLTVWWQNAPNEEFTRGSVPALSPASPATFAVNADGRLEVHHRQADTGAVAVSWQDADSRWRSTTSLGGHAGIGQPATATVGGRIATVVRNRGGGVSLALQTAPDAGYGGWIDLGGFILEYPTVAAARDGRLVVAAVHADGQLRHRTRAPDGTWTGWQPVESPL
ncbi:PIG-L family deacetylase [Geodermatophilus amargosae]|uniref:PIG-L family deacetylase n=1 Tax=Geodermatophilus amargosae TaxID=1296565 RepID=UPI0034DF1243